MQKKQIVLYLGYSALILLALYFAVGILKIGGDGLAALGYSEDSIKEGFIEGMTNEEKEEKKQERLQKQLEKQVKAGPEALEDRYDELREQLENIEGIPEYQTLIDFQKETAELHVRLMIKDCIIENKPLDSKSAAIIKNMQLLKALDMVGSGSGGYK